MKFKINFLWYFFVGLALLLTSCNKDEEEATPEPETIAFNQEEVVNQLPSAMLSSSDENAQTVVGLVESATDWSAFEEYFEPAEEAVIVKSSDVTYKWSWTYGSSQIIFWWTYEEDATKNYWTLEIQWDNGIRAPFLEAWENKDGTQGELKYSFAWTDTEEDEDYNDLYWVYTYEIASNGDYTFTWVYETDSDAYDNYLKYEVFVSHDGSGSVSYYLTGSLFYMAEWDASGNGTLYYYLGGGTYTYTWTV